MGQADESAPSVRQLSKTSAPRGRGTLTSSTSTRTTSSIQFRRLNSIDGVPVSLEQTLIPVKFFPGIEDVDVSVFSLYETYAMCGRKVALAQEKLDVVALSTRDAGLLQVEPGSLALSLECLSFDEQGRPVEHAYALNTGRRSGYTYEY